MKTFIYGLKARPPSIGAVPKGFDEWVERDDVPVDIKNEWHESNYRHGIIRFSEALPAQEISSYELIDMNTPPKEKMWEKFVEFCVELIEYEVEFKEFVSDYIHPKGDVRENNPLHRLKSTEFFALLKGKGYSGDMKGLEVFYNNL